MEQEIRGLFFELGMPVIQKSIQVSPRYTTIHYNLVHLNQYNDVPKKTKFVSAYIHKDILVQKSKLHTFQFKYQTIIAGMLTFMENTIAGLLILVLLKRGLYLQVLMIVTNHYLLTLIHYHTF